MLIIEMFGALSNFALKVVTHSLNWVPSLILHLYEHVYIYLVLQRRLFETS